MGPSHDRPDSTPGSPAIVANKFDPISVMAVDSVLTRLLETSCLLSLARLSRRTDLRAYAQLSVETIKQFLPVQHAMVSVTLRGLPRVCAGLGDAAGACVRLPLSVDGTTAGFLALDAAGADLLGTAMLESLAQHISEGVGAVAAVEYLQRDVAQADLGRAAFVAGERAESDQLEELAVGVAFLPGAFGAQLVVEHFALGGRFEVIAGLVGDDAPEYAVDLPGGGTATLLVEWTAPPGDHDGAIVGSVLDALAAGFGRGEELRSLLPQAGTDTVSGVGTAREHPAPCGRRRTGRPASVRRRR